MELTKATSQLSLRGSPPIGSGAEALSCPHLLLIIARKDVNVSALISRSERPDLAAHSIGQNPLSASREGWWGRGSSQTSCLEISSMIVAAACLLFLIIAS